MNGFGIDEVKSLIPHRYPFLLVDRVEQYDLEAGTLEAIKNVTINEPYFQGHFPVKPVMPGVLMVEALAQACGLLIVQHIPREDVKKYLFYLAGVDQVRFKHMVTPGDQLRLSVSVVKQRGVIWKFSAKAMVDDAIACQCEITIVRDAEVVKEAPSE